MELCRSARARFPSLKIEDDDDDAYLAGQCVQPRLVNTDREERNQLLLSATSGKSCPQKTKAEKEKEENNTVAIRRETNGTLCLLSRDANTLGGILSTVSLLDRR